MPIRSLQTITRVFKAFLVVWILGALLTQSMAAGLSCVHHLPNHPVNTSSQINSHANDNFKSFSMMESREFKTPSNMLSTEHYAHIQQEMTTTDHCQLTAGKTNNSANPDCKCTYFISVELLNEPLSVMMTHATTSGLLIDLPEAFSSNDIHTIFRPPLHA